MNNSYPNRVNTKDLATSIKTTNIYTYLSGLENEKLIHKNGNGSKLTRLGIKYVEEEILKQSL